MKKVTNSERSKGSLDLVFIIHAANFAEDILLQDDTMAILGCGSTAPGAILPASVHPNSEAKLASNQGRSFGPNVILSLTA